MPLRVLIIGASIAGPTAAYWISRAGATVTVIERSPCLRPGGHNIDIRTSGITVMRRMEELEATVRQNKMQLDGLCLVRDDRMPYGTIRESHHPDQQSVLSEYEIFRGTLSKCIYDMSECCGNVEYRFGEEVRTFDETEDHVRVEFVSGSKQDFDLVVACDGAGSKTRAMVFGNETKNEYRQSTGCWAAYFSIQNILHDETGEKIGYGHSSIPGRFLSVEPKCEGENIVQMMSLGNSPEQLAEFREASKLGQAPLQQHLIKAFQGHEWRTEEILHLMQTSNDLYAGEITTVKIPKLFKGRFVLVGDAGYAPGFTGTGTSLALTGAYVLAGEVLKAQGDLQAGLEEYEKTMRPIIKEMSFVPPFVPGVMAPQTALGLWLRNSIFTVLAWSKLLEYARSFFGSSGGKVSESPLPKYDWIRG